MAQYDIKLDEQELLGLLSSSEQFKGLIEPSAGRPDVGAFRC
jgi:hypothetical protein